MSPYTLHCDCHSVTYTLMGSPAARAYCHCADCRDFYATPIFAATAWHKDALRVSSGASHLGQPYFHGAGFW